MYLARRKSAGGLSYSNEVFTVKVTKKFRKNIELEMFQQTVGHPYLVQLVSFFQNKVLCSFLMFTHSGSY